MLEEKDLQAIKELLNAQSEQFDAKIDGLRQHFDLILENEIRPNFKILAEGHETILQQVNPRLDDLEQRVDHLETEVMLLKSAI